MNKHDLLVKSAIASLLAFGTMTMNSGALAAHKPKMEHCLGIAKAGKNDCAGKSTIHSCKGMAKDDSEKDSFVLVPKGTCDKIVGGTVGPMK